ncbi:MAG TPA: FG-GAP-like repeat-containing protein [Acidobacteriota bacterium]|nr:FG-GAP-like repeat-containing protein [Acidobacteriota bacterium]
MRILRTLKLTILFTLPALLIYFSGAAAHREDARTRQLLELNNRGVALMDQFQFGDAASVFKRMVELDPSVPTGWVNLGIAQFYDRLYDEAEESLKRGLEREPENLCAHYVLGLLYQTLDRVEEAVEAFRFVNREDPQDPATNYFLGRLQMRTRDYEGAVGYFRKVIEREPYNASAHYNLAMALSRYGRAEEGRQAMEQFQRLQDLFGSAAVGLQYLEQGDYAAAIDRIPDRFLPAPPPRPERIEVVFREASAEAGLRFQHAGPGTTPLRVTTKGELEERIVPYVGSGVAAFDFDGDGAIDLFLPNAGPGATPGALFRNRGDGTFEDVTADSGIAYSGNTMQAVWGDFDGDGRPDLYLINYGPNVLYRNLGDGRFEDVTERTGTGDPSWGVTGGFVDLDHDGDLDLVIGNFINANDFPEGGGAFPESFTGAANVVYRNNANGSFTDISRSSRLAGGSARTTAIVASDFDNSRDIDLYVVNYLGPNQLYSNLRDGTFENVAPRAGIGGAGTGVGVGIGDHRGSGFLDVALPSMIPGRSALLKNLGNFNFQSAGLFGNEGVPADFSAHQIHFFDYNNDGNLDILVVSAPLFAPEGGLTRRQNFLLLENRNGRFVDVTSETGLDQIQGKPIRGVAIADLNGNGALDIVASVNGDAPLLLRNHGAEKNHWIAVRPEGVNSNTLGYGVKAEIQAGRLWQKQELYGFHGFLGQSSPVLHFGLGQRDSVDVVRLLWPNGVLQSEIDRPVNRVVTISELDRKGTSCPLLYVWNGETFQFQTDFLGGSAYGYQVAPGQFNYPDRDEYIKLNREDVALRNGRVVVTFNNQLEEVIFYDRTELVAVDHPADYEIYPDEKLLPGPPYQPFRILTASNPRPPAAAWNQQGRSVLHEIGRIDRIYPDLFRKLPFKGYAEPHELILDLGDASDERTILLMHSWIDYADSTSNVAAAQAGHVLIPPFLQVRDQNGDWVTVIERMGFPAGLPKTMTVDLSGKFLSSSRDVRIVTSMRISWDQILVESGPARDDFRLHRVPVERAELRFHGFPKIHMPDGREPREYIWEEAASEPPWKVHVGAYTRFGDVTPLLRESNDQFVVTRSGDEVEIAYDVSGLPPLPEGWVRDYLVYVEGYGKDMDPNSAAPHFLGPLPFSEMTSFPYGPDERYPDTEEHRRYLEQWNTRFFHQAVPDLRPRPQKDYADK